MHTPKYIILFLSLLFFQACVSVKPMSYDIQIEDVLSLLEETNPDEIRKDTTIFIVGDTRIEYTLSNIKVHYDNYQQDDLIQKIDYWKYSESENKYIRLCTDELFQTSKYNQCLIMSPYRFGFPQNQERLERSQASLNNLYQALK
jgi:hypothetical protein